MKKIEILGTGCAKCKKLHEAVEKQAENMGIEYSMEKVEDLSKIMAYGVMMTPALVIDGKVVSSGKLLSAREIEILLRS